MWNGRVVIGEIMKVSGNSPRPVLLCSAKPVPRTICCVVWFKVTGDAEGNKKGWICAASCNNSARCRSDDAVSLLVGFMSSNRFNRGSAESSSDLILNITVLLCNFSKATLSIVVDASVVVVVVVVVVVGDGNVTSSSSSASSDAVVPSNRLGSSSVGNSVVVDFFE